ncbi:MAG: ABC transporter substrate-binding protein, partial [Actinobacteria bacterium]|nr:ABC transporter substrate-binding protein [Actinomycetota bacterium]
MRALAACATVAAALLAGLVGVAGLPGAFAGRAAEPGITPTEIILGGTAPLTGPASAYASVARGAEAYFRHVNARGGVHGRKIAYRYVDDAYNPALAVSATRQLVEDDGVFAVFNSLGTEGNLAVRGYLNQRRVPQLFVASGATTFGRDFRRYPWTIGFQPSYEAEGWIYGTFLARTRRGAKVAVLFQNDEYGKDLLAGLRRGIARSGVKVVATQRYDASAPDVGSQIATLEASGADTLALFATPKFATQAYLFAERLAWRPLVLVNAVSSASNVMRAAAVEAPRAVEGSVSLAYFKDPGDVRWRDDAGMKL